MIADIAEHDDDSPHRLGTLPPEKVHKRSQQPPMGLFRNPGIINEHAKRKVRKSQR